MTKLRSFLVVLSLLSLLGCGAGTASEGFKLIHVDELVALLSSSDQSTTVLDANGADFRAKEGIIPGATLLSGYRTYDVEKELPPRKDARLVFYCADSH
jgi:hypothetical protein